MNRLFLLIGFSLFWSGATIAQDLVFENGFENHPEAVEILSLKATPDAIIVGDNSNLAWVLKDATSCTATDGTPEWQALSFDGTDGNFDVINLPEGNHTFTLTCTGPIGDPSVAVEQILVQAPAVCGPPDLNGSSNEWLKFWNQDFPNQSYDFRTWQVYFRGYSAIKFQTADVVGTGLFESPNNIFTDGDRLGVLTKCEGRFDNVPSACKLIWNGNAGGITWSTEGTLGACQLDANSTYFLNVTFTDGVDPDTTICPSNGDCTAIIKHTLQP